MTIFTSIKDKLTTLLLRKEGWKPMTILMWVAELILTCAVVWFVPYTEIDWIAYMQEVAGPIEDNDWDYLNLKGDTGPLVYPAGFVYLYSLLYWITDHGKNIARAQWLFVGFYMLFISLVYGVYYKVAMSLYEYGRKLQSKAKAQTFAYAYEIPPWILLLLSSSRRIHSIFVLRLFNDALAMVFLFAAILLFLNKKWKWGCFVFSLAVSIKMNVLLFAPALFFLLLKVHGILMTIPHLAICALVQVLLAIPFLQANFWGYIIKAFELSRVFTYKWTVNWKFISEEAFVDKRLAIGLLLLQLIVTVFFIWKRWFKHEGWNISWSNVGSKMAELSPAHFVVLMFESNFIGLVFSRTIHYQFYVWYHATLPLLLWQSRLPVVVRILAMVCIEVSYNVYPATPWSSLMLQISHYIILCALAMSIVPTPWINFKIGDRKKKD